MHDQKSSQLRSINADQAKSDRGGASGPRADALNRAAPVQAQMALDAALNRAVQRKPEDERLDELQMKREDDELQLKEEDEEDLTQLKKNDTGLPDHVKSGVESMSGRSLDGVNVHYNSALPAQLNALAYTKGSDIHVAPGQEQHVAHEAWHVVQQMDGRVQPTTSVQGVQVNDDHGLEREADVMGARAERHQPSTKEL